MNIRPETRLHLFFAEDNSKALILLRNRSREFRLILWDRADDSFTDGQWLRRQVYPEQCRLSPDGRYFLYVGYDGRLQSQAGDFYTAISEPPYFTAHALFPSHFSWTSGGAFVGSDLYWIAGNARAANILQEPPGLKRVVEGQVTKTCRTGLRLMDGKPAPLSKPLRDQLLAHEKDQTRDHELDRYDTQNGCLWRREGGDMILIRDFRGMEFERVRAPYDTTVAVPGDEVEHGWHPLDAEGA